MHKILHRTRIITFDKFFKHTIGKYDLKLDQVIT